MRRLALPRAAHSNIAASSRRKPGPITPGRRSCEERRRACFIDASRGMGPGSRSRCSLAQDDGRECGARLSPLLAITNSTWLHVPAAPRRPSFASCSPSRKTEGAGNAGCALHPRSHVHLAQKENAHEHTGEAEAVRHPLRSGLTAYTGLSLVTGLSCHHHRRDAKHHRQLDASVGAPGPHGFAVRDMCRSSSGTFASTASRLTFRDDREAPLMWRRDGQKAARDLPDAASVLPATDWHDGQIAHNGHV